MDRILNRVCSIKNHPLSEMDEKYRTRYVSGLGACLFYLSHNSSVTKMFFDVWAKSILRCDINIKDFWRYDLRAIKEAISIQRKGIKLFSMRHDFFFDSIYLIQSSMPNGYSTNLTANINKQLSSDVCGMFSKRALKYVCEYFNGKNGYDGKRINSNIREHKLINETILAKTEKKILVVANVSAGKSTLINALVGHRVNKAKTTACTNKIVMVSNKFGDDGATIKDSNGEYKYYADVESCYCEDFINIAFQFNIA